MARSLHESKQKIHCTRTKGPWSRQIDWSNKTENHNQTKNDDPQIPQPDMRFASGNSEANSRKHNKTQKTGPEPKQKHPPNRFTIGRSGISTALLSKTCKMNMDHSCPGRHEDHSSGENPSMSQNVHESRATMKSLSESSQINSSWAFMDVIVILLTVSRDLESMV